MGYSEIHYNCSINPNSAQCQKNYTLDGELPLRYSPTYQDLNYTFIDMKMKSFYPNLIDYKEKVEDMTLNIYS